MLCVKEMVKKFLIVIDVSIFIQNTRRNTAAEKEIDIAVKMTLKHVLVQRRKKTEIDEKNNF